MSRFKVSVFALFLLVSLLTPEVKCDWDDLNTLYETMGRVNSAIGTGDSDNGSESKYGGINAGVIAAIVIVVIVAIIGITLGIVMCHYMRSMPTCNPITIVTSSPDSAAAGAAAAGAVAQSAIKEEHEI